MTPRRLTLLAALCCLIAFRALAAETEKQDSTVVPLDYFVVPEGLEVKLWARTPLLKNPTNIDIDEAGRIWVAEGVNYRSHRRRQPEGDRVAVLEDTNGDGLADTSRTFVQEAGFIAPLGIAVIDNKVIVSQPPDLIVFTDVNRNQRFDPEMDKREVLLTGFNGQNHDHSLHSVTVGPEGRWYWNMGNTGALFTDRSGKTFRVGSPYNHAPGTRQVVDSTKIAAQKSDDGHVYIGGFTARMNSDGTGVEIIGHNYRNSYEQAVTSFGDVFQSDNDDPPACRVSFVMEYGNAGFASLDGQRSWQADRRPGQSTPVAEWRQEDPGSMPPGDVYGGGSPTGVAFYENGALGKQFEGLLLACEAGRNVVFGYYPKLEGAGFKLERFDFLTSNKEKQFGGSDFLGGGRSVKSEIKTFFRPSDVAVGPDGAIYVADWFDPRVGGHSDLDNTTSGAIYRIAPKGFKPAIPKFDANTIKGQIQALKSPAPNVRALGFYRLKAQGAKAVPAVADLLKDKNPYIAARGIWLLAQLGPKGVSKVTPLLSARDERTRIVAYRALRRANHDFLRMAARMAKDASPAVRREVALSLRDVPLGQSREILAEIARRYDGKDRSYLEALGTGCSGKETAMYDALAAGAGGPATNWTGAFARIAWRLSSPNAVGAFQSRALTATLPLRERKLAVDALAFVPSQSAADAMLSLVAATNFPFKAEATWWLFNRQNNYWKDFGILAEMRKRGLYNPDAQEFVSVTVPEVPSQPSTLPPIEKILTLAGDPKRGQQVALACAVCHQIGSSVGTDLGPDLTAFGKTQTREVILRSMIEPSAEISQGYDGGEVVTKNNVTIHGLILANGDPVIVKSQGGLTQTIPRSQVARQRRMNRSLMLSADEMGLAAQDLADVAAYLQSNLIPESQDGNR
jgi:putative membrane-bound dehydrogenase-like protein